MSALRVIKGRLDFDVYLMIRGQGGEVGGGYCVIPIIHVYDFVDCSFKGHQLGFSE